MRITPDEVNELHAEEAEKAEPTESEAASA
jgi:hypothetical protein